MFGISQGSKEETVSFQWKNLRSHILRLCLALPIAFQQRSKWPPPPPRFDKGQDNLTLRGCRGQGKAGSAAGAAGAGGAERGPGGARAEEAGRAGTAARPARCCDGSGTGCCFWLVTPRAWPWSQETVTLLGAYLHLNHQLLQQLDRVEWRLWASPPNCDQNIGKRSSWGVPSCGLSESHRSSQSAASEKVVLVNKLSVQRVLSLLPEFCDLPHQGRSYVQHAESQRLCFFSF